MNRIRHYRIILETGLGVLSVRLALRVVNLPRLLSWLTAGPVASIQDLQGMDDAVYYTDRWLERFPYNPKGNCFPRSLTLLWFARKFGFSPQFRCGVARLNGKLEGHAWLMLQEKEFFEPSAYWRSFAVTVAFPPNSAPSNPVQTRVQ